MPFSERNAARVAGNLSELTLTLGKVSSAVAAGQESVELADRSQNAFEQMSNRATLADALHQAGRWEESAAWFREAEAIQVELEPTYPRLYGLQGNQYCDLLLGRGEAEDGSGLEHLGRGVGEGSALTPEAVRYREACEEARERASQTLDWMEGVVVNMGHLDIALGYLFLGRACLGLALTSPDPDFSVAAEHLDRSVDFLRHYGSDQHIPRGLLARAALHRLRGDLADAAADLTEAEEIAERGHMLLHQADACLEWVRLHLQRGESEPARERLERARTLVESTGYGRREREVRWLAGRVGG